MTNITTNDICQHMWFEDMGLIETAEIFKISREELYEELWYDRIRRNKRRRK